MVFIIYLHTCYTYKQTILMKQIPFADYNTVAQSHFVSLSALCFV